MEGGRGDLPQDVRHLMFGLIEGLLSRERTVSVYRPTQSSGGGGQPEFPAGTALTTSLRMRVEQISGGQRERAFGQRSEAEWRGMTTPDANVQENDLIVPNTGPYAGVVMEVESTLVRSQGHPTATEGAFMVLALKRTTKTV
jgi:hypothetical protein